MRAASASGYKMRTGPSWDYFSNDPAKYAAIVRAGHIDLFADPDFTCLNSPQLLFERNPLRCGFDRLSLLRLLLLPLGPRITEHQLRNLLPDTAALPQRDLHQAKPLHLFFGFDAFDQGRALGALAPTWPVLIRNNGCDAGKHCSAYCITSPR